MLVHRDGAWLLSVRAPGGRRTPRDALGLVGGHVEADAPAAGVLEATGRRELVEEVGLDLTGVPLTYLESEYFVTERRRASGDGDLPGPGPARPGARGPTPAS